MSLIPGRLTITSSWPSPFSRHQGSAGHRGAVSDASRATGPADKSGQARPMTPRPSCRSRAQSWSGEELGWNPDSAWHLVSGAGREGARRERTDSCAPKQEVAEPEKVEGYLYVLLGIPGPDVIGGVVILRADSEDSKEDGQPRRGDGFGYPGGRPGILGSILEVDHESGLEVVDVDDKAPEGLRDFLVCAEEPVGRRVSRAALSQSGGRRTQGATTGRTS